MANLWLKYMVAVENQEWPRDELYMKIDGQEVWSEKKVSDGETLNINKVFTITGSSDRIDLFEDDWLGSDEHLGTKYAYSWQQGTGEHTVSFTNHGAHYDLVYQVF